MARSHQTLMLAFLFVGILCSKGVRSICIEAPPLNVEHVRGCVLTEPDQFEATPIPGAAVRLLVSAGDGFEELEEEKTSKEGCFAFEDVDPGLYRLEAEATGFDTYSRQVRVRRWTMRSRGIIVLNLSIYVEPCSGSSRTERSSMCNQCRRGG